MVQVRVVLSGLKHSQNSGIFTVSKTNSHDAYLRFYGCYVIGRNWFFVIVNEREYSVSLAYDATKPELYTIYAIMSAAPSLIKPYL